MKTWIITTIGENGSLEAPRSPYLADQDVPASMMELPDNNCLCRVAGTPAQIATILAYTEITEQTDAQAERLIKAKWFSDVSRLTAEKFIIFLEDLARSDSDLELIQTLKDDYPGFTVDEILVKFDEIPTLLDDIGNFVDLENIDIADPEVDEIAKTHGLDPKLRADIQIPLRGKQVLPGQENHMLALIATKKGKSKAHWDDEAAASGKWAKGIDIENDILDGTGAAHEFMLSRLR